MRDYSLVTANTRRLFLHDVSTIKDPSFQRHPFGECPGVWLERALCVAGPKDLVLLTSPIDSAYLTYLKQLTLTDPAFMVPAVPGVNNSVDVTAALLADLSWTDQLAAWLSSSDQRAELSCFSTTQETVQLHQHLVQTFGATAWGDTAGHGDPDATLGFNRKSKLRDWLPELGLEAIPGLVFTIDQSAPAGLQVWAAIQPLLQAHGRIMVKADYASNGAGNLLVGPDSCAQLIKWVESASAHVETFIAEAYLQFSTSPNVQFHIDHTGQCHYLGASIQRFSPELRFRGNYNDDPVIEDTPILEQASLIVAHLAATGVRGVVGLDFLILPDRTTRFVEVNARYNGSSYAQSIVDKVNNARTAENLKRHSHWRHLRVDTDPYATFEQLAHDAGDTLLQSCGSSGIVPFVPTLIARGIVNFVTIGASMEEVTDLEERFIHNTGKRQQ